MRVLAVAQPFHLAQIYLDRVWESHKVGLCRFLRRQEPGDLSVVIGGVFKGPDGEPVAKIERQYAAESIEFIGYRRVIIGIDDHGHVVMILGRGADHRRAADVDVFDRLLHRHVGFFNLLVERVQVDDYQVDRLYAVFAHLRAMLLVRADAEDAAMNFRVQSLDAAVEHFRKSGEVRNVARLDSVLAQQLRGTAGRNDLDAAPGELPRKFDQSPLVRDADERPADLLQ